MHYEQNEALNVLSVNLSTIYEFIHKNLKATTLNRCMAGNFVFLPIASHFQFQFICVKAWEQLKCTFKSWNAYTMQTQNQICVRLWHQISCSIISIWTEIWAEHWSELYHDKENSYTLCIAYWFTMKQRPRPPFFNYNIQYSISIDRKLNEWMNKTDIC